MNMEQLNNYYVLQLCDNLFDPNIPLEYFINIIQNINNIDLCEKLFSVLCEYELYDKDDWTELFRIIFI